MAQSSGFLTQDVPSSFAYPFGSAVAGAGLGALIAGGVALGNVPDSLFGAATYLGLTGVAVAVRTNSNTAQNLSPGNFIERAVVGLVLLAAAGFVEIAWDKPDLASWAVYVGAVGSEFCFFLRDARRQGPTPTPPPTPTPTPTGWLWIASAFVVPALLGFGLGSI